MSHSDFQCLKQNTSQYIITVCASPLIRSLRKRSGWKMWALEKLEKALQRPYFLDQDFSRHPVST